LANPLVAQGSLNRLLASVVINAFPQLNVTASYLGKAGIKLSLQGEAVTYLPTLTGQVTSPDPYMGTEIMMDLIKSQALANQYKLQMESNALIGDVLVYPDAAPLNPYQIVNCSIKSVRELDFSGESYAFMVTLGGYYLVNNQLFG
jgi:hypothetical protein